jgi:hypothetical protein
LLTLLAVEGTLVEINLTSNDRVLGVKDAEHPFLDYFSHDVPVALSTDDERDRPQQFDERGIYARRGATVSATASSKCWCATALPTASCRDQHRAYPWRSGALARRRGS